MSDEAAVEWTALYDRARGCMRYLATVAGLACEVYEDERGEWRAAVRLPEPAGWVETRMPQKSADRVCPQAEAIARGWVGVSGSAEDLLRGILAKGDERG